MPYICKSSRNKDLLRERNVVLGYFVNIDLAHFIPLSFR